MSIRKDIVCKRNGLPLQYKTHACPVRPLWPRFPLPGKHGRHRCDRRVLLQAKLGEDERHVLSAPGPPDDKQQLASVLLMLLPGAYMKCEAYDGLLTRLKVCSQITHGRTIHKQKS